MSTSLCDTAVLPPPSATSRSAGSLCFLPIEQLRTSYAPYALGRRSCFPIGPHSCPSALCPQGRASMKSSMASSALPDGASKDTSSFL